MKRFLFIEVNDGISKKEFETFGIMKDAVKRINQEYNEKGYSPLRVVYKLDFLKEPLVIKVPFGIYYQHTKLKPNCYITNYREVGIGYIAKDESYVIEISKRTSVKENKWIIILNPIW